ncbi:hypothetical protein AGOR_G00032320 [Albula goreensis]|uniref:Uncharacterized protein n=1 Tax=Albula goreensis TaxID=1534307 RepID=A0A8T3DVX2_9TELE|nr:hypothetical protein AGOR_G00032320 [Albula goreensis]
MEAEVQKLSGSTGFLRYAAPSLENRILTQATSTLIQHLDQPHPLCTPPAWASSLACPALQASHLSSTVSPFHLSSTITSSPLLSTQNRLLQSAPLPPLAPAPGPPAGEEEEPQAWWLLDSSEGLQSPIQTLSEASEQECSLEDPEEVPTEIPVPKPCVHDEEEELTVPQEEEFGEVEEESSEQEEELIDKKVRD